MVLPAAFGAPDSVLHVYVLVAAVTVYLVRGRCKIYCCLAYLYSFYADWAHLVVAFVTPTVLNTKLELIATHITRVELCGINIGQGHKFMA